MLFGSRRVQAGSVYLAWPALLLAGLVLLGASAARSRPQAASEALYVVTHVDSVPKDAAMTAKALQEYAADSRKDPGVVRFEVLQELARPNHFTIVEVWQSREAFEAHEAAGHTRHFREVIQPSLGSPFDERLHRIL